VKQVSTVRAALVVAVLVMGSARCAPAQTKEECLACHSDASLKMTRGGEAVSLFVDSTLYNASVHKDAECITCHEGFDPGNLPHKTRITPVNCASCHETGSFWKSVHGTALRSRRANAPQCRSCHSTHAIQPAKRITKDAHACLQCHRWIPHVAQYTKSVHAEVGPNGTVNASCVDCHGGHTATALREANALAKRQADVALCTRCHAVAKATYESSTHAKALAAGMKEAPSCVDCHGDHGVVETASPDSPMNRKRQAAKCLICHLDNPDIRNQIGVSARFVKGYEQSVHGMAAQSGKSNAAICSDCHGAHTILPGNDPASSVNRANIPATCAKCHSQIARTFNESIHGKAVAKGILSAPICTNCHGEHDIKPPSDPSSPVAVQNVSQQVCTPCHSSVQMARRFNIPEGRTSTYFASYHGLAVEGGSTEAANCASCHGVHDIKPSSDPTSSINKANLARTCGKCHPGANQNFTATPIHLNAAVKEEPIIYYVTMGYVVLIVTIIGGMFIHNLLDFIKKARRKLLLRRLGGGEHALSGEVYLRMAVNERIQHAVLLVSFITLVITGFMLHFPEILGLDFARQVGGTTVFDLRSLLHRVAALMLLAVGLYHIGYLSLTQRGRQLFVDLLPRFKDLQDAIGVAKFNLGLSEERPQFDRFSYIEKSEYWALVWGTVVMGATGFIMWFENYFIAQFSKLLYDVSRVVHYYEAWLATLAIIVWHFYSVIFNPDVYPLNQAAFTGTLSEEEMEEEHPLELERIRSARREKEEEEVNVESSGETAAEVRDRSGVD